MITVRPSTTAASARSTAASVAGSRLEVASSSTITAGSARATRAIPTSCRSPADNRTPRVWTSVWIPSGSDSKRLARADLIESVQHGLVGGLRIGEAHVVGDRAAEEVPLLREHHDPVAQRLERRVPQVDAAERDRALLRVVLAREQLRERRLARAGDAHQRDVLAGLQLQRDALHHAAARLVAEADVAQLERAVGGKVDRAWHAP